MVVTNADLRGACVDGGPCADYHHATCYMLHARSTPLSRTRVPRFVGHISVYLLMRLSDQTGAIFR